MISIRILSIIALLSALSISGRPLSTGSLDVYVNSNIKERSGPSSLIGKTESSPDRRDVDQIELVNLAKRFFWSGPGVGMKSKPKPPPSKNSRRDVDQSDVDKLAKRFYWYEPGMGMKIKPNPGEVKNSRRDVDQSDLNKPAKRFYWYVPGMGMKAKPNPEEVKNSQHDVDQSDHDKSAKRFYWYVPGMGMHHKPNPEEVKNSRREVDQSGLDKIAKRFYWYVPGMGMHHKPNPEEVKNGRRDVEARVTTLPRRHHRRDIALEVEKRLEGTPPTHNRDLAIKRDEVAASHFYSNLHHIKEHPGVAGRDNIGTSPSVKIEKRFWNAAPHLIQHLGIGMRMRDGKHLASGTNWERQSHLGKEVGIGGPDSVPSTLGTQAIEKRVSHNKFKRIDEPGIAGRDNEERFSFFDDPAGHSHFRSAGISEAGRKRSAVVKSDGKRGSPHPLD